MRPIWIAIALAASLSGAETSHFDGAWTRDAARSDLVGGRIGGPARDVQAVTLVIEHRDGLFQVTRTVSFDGGQATPLIQRFPLDGKEVANPSPAPGGRRGEVRSKARLEAGHVIVEGIQRITALNGGIDVKTTDIYAVSPDGQTLTVTTTRTNANDSQTRRQVYRKEVNDRQKPSHPSRSLPNP